MDIRELRAVIGDAWGKVLPDTPEERTLEALRDALDAAILRDEERMLADEN